MKYKGKCVKTLCAAMVALCVLVFSGCTDVEKRAAVVPDETDTAENESSSEE